MFLVLWGRGRDQKRAGPAPGIEMRKIPTMAEAPIVMRKINKINWKIENWQFPKIIEIPKLVLREWAENDFKEWNINQGNKYFYFDKESNKVTWGEGIYKEEQLAVKRSISPDEMKSILVGVIRKIDSRVGLKVTGTDYKEKVAMNWMTTTKEKAGAVEIKGVYEVNKIPVYWYGKEPVIAFFRPDGEVIKMEIDLPWRETGAEEMAKIRGFEEIRNLDNSQFKVFDVTGGRGFELTSDWWQEVEEAEVTGAELIYIYNPKQKGLIPYFMLHGGAKIGGEPVVVRLIVEAVKE